MKLRSRIDSNQTAIVRALEATGATVQTLGQVGRGCPDLLVGRLGVNVLLEVKSEKGSLTTDQEEWHGWWRGQKAVVRDEYEAVRLVLQLTTPPKWSPMKGR